MMLACVLLAFAGAAQATDATIGVTIAQLIAHPNDYAGKTVEVRGQVDNCLSLSCNLCPEDMTDASFDRDKCLGMSFTGFDDPDPQSALRASEMMEWMFRFATLTLTARFDPACLTGKDPDDPQATVVCTDRASVLHNAVVNTVHSRKNGDTGIASAYRWGEFSKPSDVDRRAMLALLAVFISDKTPELLIVPDFRDEKAGVTAGGYGCYCLADDCTGKWPKRWVGGSTENLDNAFYCIDLQKRHGAWEIVPNVF
jgi:hypothetical protein